MFEFEFDQPLFEFAYASPQFEPLFELPPKIHSFHILTPTCEEIAQAFLSFLSSVGLKSLGVSNSKTICISSLPN